MAERMWNIPTLTLATRDHRWALARKFMQDQQLDALFVYGEHEDSGAAPFNFDVWFTNSRPGTTVLFPRRGEPIHLLPFPPGAMDYLTAANNGEEMWMAAKNLRLGRSISTVAAVLDDLGLSAATIGVIGLDPCLPWHTDGIIPYRLWSGVLSEFPKATFKPVFEAFVRVILPLNEEEQAVIRYAGTIGEAMAKAMVAAARSGARESDVFAAGTFAANSRGSATPWLHICTSPTPVSWGAPDWSYKATTPKIIKAGDAICTEVFTFVGALNTQQQLAITVGEVSEEFERAAAIARQCYEIGLKAVRPGAVFGDIGRAMLKPVQDAGGWSRGPQIHSLNPLYAISGFESNLDQVQNVEKFPNISAVIPTIFEDLVLEPGMTFALEPGCGFGSHTVSLGSSVLVTDEGVIELTPYTSRLHRVD